MFELNIMAWEAKPLIEKLRSLETEEEKKRFYKEVLNNSYEYNYIMNFFFSEGGLVDYFINRYVDMVIKDETQFFDQAWKNIEYCIYSYDGVSSFYLLVKTTLARLLGKLKNEAAKVDENNPFIEVIDEFEYTGYEIEDDIVSDYSVEDTIKILIKDFRQKDKAEFILKKMIDGYKSSDIAKMMSKVYGGSMATHEQFISRLKKKCEKKMLELFHHAVNKDAHEYKFYDEQARKENMLRKKKHAEFMKPTPVKVEVWDKENIKEYLSAICVKHNAKKKNGAPYDPKWEKCKTITKVEFGNKCFCCGHEAKDNHIHHAWGKKRYPELQYEQANLFLLCKNCHSPASEKEYSLHKQPGLTVFDDITGYKFLEWYKWMHYLQQKGVVDFKYITPEKIAYAERKIKAAEKKLLGRCLDKPPSSTDI